MKNPTEKENRIKAARRRSDAIRRRIAQGTLLAAGLASAPFMTAERDPRYPLFNATVVDRLHSDLTRYHE